MSAETLPCIVCLKELDAVMPDADNQPHEGLTFASLGHYGTTAFDPMDGSYLELNICDQCLVEAGRNERVLYYQFRRGAPVAQLWQPARAE